MSLEALVSVSRRYGADPSFVVAGGGNSSWKTADSLYVKASGSALATIDESGFVRMDRTKLAAIWGASYPADQDERESAVLEDMMAARARGEEAKRPSVETLLHDLLPAAFVVHTHPALVNALTCSRGGKRICEELFGHDAVWIPSTNPGYVLSKAVKEALERNGAPGRAPCTLIFLQNHGIFVAADDIAGIDAQYGRVFDALGARLKAAGIALPSFQHASDSFGASSAAAEVLGRLAKEALGPEAEVVFRRDDDIAALVADRSAFEPVSSAYSPDHIVYAGSEALFVDLGPSPSDAAARDAVWRSWSGFVSRTGRYPKLVALRAVGVFGVGAGTKAAGLAVELFMDAAKIACGSAAFGGPRFMSADQIDFINNWEVERYRTSVSTK